MRSATVRRGTVAVLLSGLATGALAMGGPARAELPAPDALPPGAVAPVHTPVAPSAAPIAPVRGASGEWTDETFQGDERFTLSGEVHFAKNDDALSPVATGILDELIASWGEEPPRRVSIVGHTDSEGPAEENQDLSERRAASVAAHLEAAVPGLEVEASGRGEEELLLDDAVGSAEERDAAMERNRRVVLTIER